MKMKTMKVMLMDVVMMMMMTTTTLESRHRTARQRSQNEDKV